MLKPEAALEHAGKGLREVLRGSWNPPVLHMGSCVDNSRILEAVAEVVKEGGLGEDIFPCSGCGYSTRMDERKKL